MKKTKCLLMLLMAIVMMAMSPTRVWAELTSSFMVMSDMHVMSTSLFDNGTAFTAYVQTEPKLVENSQDVFDDAIAKIKTAKPDFLLIPGDLTKDGEKVSHEHVAAKLKELVAEGINVYVIPGNHDIGNPNAKSYLGDAPAAVTSLTADEWKSADFYQSCGYANAVMTSGLSYMAYPADGIALIALDSRKPDTETAHYSEGGLTEATLAWAETAAAKAKAEGRVIIGMMHHPIMEHFDGHKDIGPTYLANQAQGYPALADVQQRLVAAGIGTMFTGHFHLQSIQYEETTSGTLYDVMTGSLSSYPMAMRSGTIARSGNITVASITDVASSEVIAKAKARNAITTQGVFAVLANKMAAKISAKKAQDQAYAAMLANVPSTQSDIMSLLNTHMKASYDVLMNSLAAGDEEQDSPSDKISACTSAYDAFLDGMFASLGSPYAATAKGLLSGYTAQNTAMVTSVFSNKKGTGDVVADNTNTSLKTIANDVTQLTTLTLNDDTDPTSMFAVLYTANKVQDITITRTLYKDGYYNTLCLPFALTAEQLAADNCPLKGCTLKKVTGASISGEGTSKTMTIALDDATALEAGKPYLIKWAAASENIVNPTFTGVTITVGIPSKYEGTNLDVVGIFAPKWMESSDLFFLGANNTFYTTSAPNSLKGYRCYFQMKTAREAKAFNIVFDEGETTGIDAIDNGQLTTDNESETYNLQGARVGSGYQGIVIRNGRKYINK